MRGRISTVPDARCRQAAVPPSSQSTRRITGMPSGDRRHRRVAPGARRHSDRRIVEAQAPARYLSTPPVGSQLPGRARGPTVTSKLPSALRMISWLVKPCRCSEFATSLPSGSYKREGPNRACGVVPLNSDIAAAVEGAARRRQCARRRPRHRPSRREFAAARDHSRGHTGRCPASRCFGQAVQAPIVTPP